MPFQIIGMDLTNHFWLAKVPHTTGERIEITAGFRKSRTAKPKECRMTAILFRVAKEFDVVSIELSQEVQDHLDKCERDELCPHCKEKLYALSLERRPRGVHESCANSLYKLIANKERDANGVLITDEYLIRRGSWREPGKRGRKPNPATAAIKEVKS